MVFHAKSKSRIRREELEEKDKNICDAVKEYSEELKKPANEHCSLQKIADKHGVSRTTVYDRWRGKTSMKDFNAQKQKLTSQEEEILVNYIVISSDWGVPLTHADIIRLADLLIKEIRGPDAEGVSDSWAYRFHERHWRRLQTYWSKPLDTQRAKSLNPDAVNGWFEILKSEILDKKIEMKDVYAMDESGFVPSNQGTQRVIGRAGNRLQHKAGGASRENTTVLVTICADGTTVSPEIIFKGKYLHLDWCKENVAGAVFTISKKGWTDNEIAFNWIKDVFEPQTCDKAEDKARVLIVDGHSSHCSLKFLRYAVAHNIAVLVYPPHCTHALQGLDVVCFAIMKRIWNDGISAFEKDTGRTVKKEDFTKIFGEAYLKAFTPETVKKAFKETGVWPVDRSVISEQQMKPSERTSVKKTFPLTMASPVKHIVHAYNAGTSCDNSHHPLEEDEGARHSPKRVSDDVIDPALQSPSKRSKVHNALSQSKSGSFLVSTARFDGSESIATPVIEKPPPLPEPDWLLLDTRNNYGLTKSTARLQEQVKELVNALELSREHIIFLRMVNERANAQMILQEFYAQGLQRALQSRKSKASSNKNRRILDNRKGMVYTSPEALEAIEQEEKEKEEKELSQKNRGNERLAKKQANEEREQAWKELKAKHEQQMREWQENTNLLRQQGVPVRQLPPKPARTKRAEFLETWNRLTVGTGAVDEDEASSDDSNDDDACAEVLRNGDD